MKVTYIHSIATDTVTIKDTKGIETVEIPTEEVKEFAKTHVVIGYNSITEQLSVKTLEDVIKWINVKIKLTTERKEDGTEVEYKLRIETDLDNDYLVAIPTVVRTMGDNGSNIYRLTLPKLVEDCIYSVDLDYSKFNYYWSSSVDGIIYDFAMPEEVIGNPILYRGMGHDVPFKKNLAYPEFTERFNLDRVEHSKGMFEICNYRYAGEDVLRPQNPKFEILCDRNKVMDLSKYTVKNKRVLDDIINTTVFENIIPPKVRK